MQAPQVNFIFIFISAKHNGNKAMYHTYMPQTKWLYRQKMFEIMENEHNFAELMQFSNELVFPSVEKKSIHIATDMKE